MIRGLYTSGWSMLANNRKMDVISNNLANVNTTGFKRDTVVFESFDSVLTKRINDTKSPTNFQNDIGNMILGFDVGAVHTYFNQGSVQNTGRSLDMSIQNSDSAFFTIGVEDGQGNMNEYYTRDGSFNLDAQGRLVTTSGDPVLGIAGPIYLNNEDFTITSDGSIIEDGETVGRLLIREFTDPDTLRKRGDNLLERTEGTAEGFFSGTVSQGTLEQSNVNIVKEMVDMITVTRSYEANQKIVTALDSTLEKAVNEVGALR